jgi:serine/threonine-protein kinase
VPRDEEISLVVSKGPEPIDVPAVEGLTLEAAQAALIGAGLVPLVDPEEFSDTVPVGSVIRQTHRGGQLFAADGVHIVPSKGPELYEVPSVLDRTQAEAETILRDAGFEVELVFPFGAAFIDRVLDQNPDGGAQLPRGTTITLQVV